MIDPLNFTEDQVKEVTQIQKHAFENGLVWGFVCTLGAVVAIAIAVLAAKQFFPHWLLK
jgi:ABC-type phosphate/phosphonate transport system permease subunit